MDKRGLMFCFAFFSADDQTPGIVHGRKVLSNEATAPDAGLLYI